MANRLPSGVPNLIVSMPAQHGGVTMLFARVEPDASQSRAIAASAMLRR